MRAPAPMDVGGTPGTADQPGGTAAIDGLLSAVIWATRTSLASRPEGLFSVTALEAVEEYAVVDVPSVTCPAVCAAVAVMKSVLLIVLDPDELVTVRDTENLPGDEYTCDGFRLVSDVPSPKSQAHAVGEPEEVSVNWTVKGAVPDAGVAEN